MIDSAQLEAALAGEASLVVLDTIEVLTTNLQHANYVQNVLGSSLEVLLHLMSCNQSQEVLKCIFASQRSVVNKFPELFYEKDNELCAELCVSLLKHCSSALPDIRAWACTSLYLLMRLNYETKNVRNAIPYNILILFFLA